MTALQSIVGKLQATRLFNLSGGTYELAEMKAFAAGLQLFYDDLETIEKEMFVATAEGEGLELYEKLLSVCNIDTSLSGRRKSILSALSIGCGDYNYDGMRKLAGIFNITGYFSEPGNNTIRFQHSVSIDAATKAMIEEQMAQLMPCGIGFVFV